MVRQFCDVTNRGNLLASFHAFGELNAVLVVDPDRRDTLLVAMQLLVVQGAVLGQSQNILLLLHQVDDFDVLADNLRLKTVMLVTRFALCVESCRYVCSNVTNIGCKVTKSFRRSQI